jgi:flavin-binding protein dodecin
MRVEVEFEGVDIGGEIEDGYVNHSVTMVGVEIKLTDDLLNTGVTKPSDAIMAGASAALTDFLITLGNMGAFKPTQQDLDQIGGCTNGEDMVVAAREATTRAIDEAVARYYDKLVNMELTPTDTPDWNVMFQRLIENGDNGNQGSPPTGA